MKTMKTGPIYGVGLLRLVKEDVDLIGNLLTKKKEGCHNKIVKLNITEKCTDYRNLMIWNHGTLKEVLINPGVFEEEIKFLKVEVRRSDQP
jgi:hypothetical protein